MRAKLELLINSEANLTQSGFAEMLGIQPATVSHILSGRNKPSCELLQKILTRFPNVSADWLLLDNGDMLRDKSKTPSGMPLAQQSLSELSLPNGPVAPDKPTNTGTKTEHPDLQQRTIFSTSSSQPSSGLVQSDGKTVGDLHIMDIEFPQTIPPQTQAGSRVEMVIVLYEDKTCRTYIVNR